MEYYSAMRKSEIFPFLTTWMGFKDIILSEKNETEKTKTVLYQLYVESTKAYLVKKTVKCW